MVRVRLLDSLGHPVGWIELDPNVVYRIMNDMPELKLGWSFKQLANKEPELQAFTLIFQEASNA